MCGTDELNIVEPTCCEELTCRVDKLEDEMNKCCTEVKQRLDGHDADINQINLDINNLEQSKVDKVPGMGLSHNDYTDADKNKLAGIEAGAQKNVQSDWNQTNASAPDYIKNKPSIPQYTGTAPISVSGTVISHNNSGVTAGSKGDTSNQTPAFGGTFKVTSETVDAKGHTTALAEHTVKIPDTLATSSTAGLMRSGDKSKLDGISYNANKTTIISVEDYHNDITVPGGETVNLDYPFTTPTGYTALGIVGFNNNYYPSVGIVRCRFLNGRIYLGLHNFIRETRVCNAYIDILCYKNE